jgi:hypothetical protein
LASRVTALACDVSTAVIVLGSSATFTVATGTGMTVTEAVPLFPSLVAVITAVPGATAATRPVGDTVATDGASELHTTARSVSALSPASLSVAESCAVEPATTSDVAGVTITVATGIGLTVIVAPPVLPSLVAVICAEPVASAVTTPLKETVATLVLSEDHVTMRPVSTLLLASTVVAVSCSVPPTIRFAVAGLTVTVATGIGMTVIVALPLLPSLVAVIVALPGITVVTRPVDDTVATDGSLELHTMVRPVSTLSLASSVVAVA